ncbi:MAG: immunoglobulin domain-containing protein [Thiogranum sp.]
MNDTNGPKKAVCVEIGFSRRSFIQAAGAAAGLLLTGCGGGSGGGGQADTSTAVVTTSPSEETTTPPALTLQPLDQTVNPGDSARFEAGASGTPAVTYQWQKNGANIPGATAASYTTPPLALQDSGSVYAVLVSNSAGTAQSDAATVIVSAAGITADSTTVTVDALAVINQ